MTNGGAGVALLGGHKTPTGDTMLRERHHLSLANGSALDATYNGSYDGNANLFKEQVTLTGPELLITRVLSGAFHRSTSSGASFTRRRHWPDATLYRRRYSANCIEPETQDVGEDLADASDTAMSEGGDTDDPEGDISSSCSSWPKGMAGRTPTASPSLSPDERWCGRDDNGAGGQDWAWMEARWLGLRRLRRQIPTSLEEKLQRVRARGWGARGRLRGLQERVKGLHLGLGGTWKGEGPLHPHPGTRDNMCRSCSLTFSSEEANDQQTPTGKLSRPPDEREVTRHTAVETTGRCRGHQRGLKTHTSDV